MTTRRGFLATLVAASSWPAISWADAGNPAFLAAAKDADGSYALFGLSMTGEDRFRIPLPDRGHAATAHPTAPEAVAFARRPGTFALVIDCVSGRLVQKLDAPTGRHFYGHGAFIGDGDILCTAENEIETGQGRIGLWSRSRGYARIGEIATGGIGPHDVKALPDDTLVVANGGIRTHPDSGRKKLNIDTMRPNLTYLGSDGTIHEQVESDPALHQNSLRHLALGPDGLVAFAFQWEGDPGESPPLLGLHRRGEAIQLLTADLSEQIAMKGYAGSIAADHERACVAITSPRGGRVHMFGFDGAFQGVVRRADVCGIGAADHGFVATDGLGGILSLVDGEVRPLAAQPRAWDNHLIAI
ncbi:DUF1513 domain-containing protein [Seohaeicola zhoushanensis]|uniref:DUF1513 domain-containing protein n=1 Tax=Seohaeicola zhoushanensis TaxID=1569283 RepID=A0A8J3H145_9RHOB|nr:DUF1513 domain-containing protein [Seohaeicola zhoushanensis]GHF69566.1 hypothetical protein GCM10017056_45840 [Seohaeicola zhoushanensis]